MIELGFSLAWKSVQAEMLYEVPETPAQPLLNSRSSELVWHWKPRVRSTPR